MIDVIMEVCYGVVRWKRKCVGGFFDDVVWVVLEELCNCDVGCVLNDGGFNWDGDWWEYILIKRWFLNCVGWDIWM